MVNSKEVVKATLQFKYPDRLAVDFPTEYGTDFKFINMRANPDYRPSKGKDEWNAVWDNIGISKLGEVKEFPLKSWDDFESMHIPDVTEDKRWEGVKENIENHKDKFTMGVGIPIYERVHFLRGLENTWIDIYENTDYLCQLIDILTDMNVHIVERFARYGVDSLIFADDWGLQNSLMISPDKWREIWKPRYKRIYKAAHDNNMYTILHSCGDIRSILDDLIDAGLDCIQMDQQQNMGLEYLGKYKDRITFFCPVDIQNIFVKGSLDEIRRYCHTMFHALGSKKGGFMPKWYSDPVGAGHRREAIDAMCQEFLKISADVFGHSHIFQNPL